MAQTSSGTTAVHHAVPFWRDVRALRIMSQVIFILAVAIVAGMLYANLTHALEKRGLSGGFDFLRLEAGFEIGESPISYKPANSYGRAFLVGVLNTLRVTVVGIFFATILGVVAGVARLSDNWLVRSISGIYIEVIRNTPLLVQLFFWYFAVMFKAPPVSQSLELPGPIYVHKRGVSIPWAYPTSSFQAWIYYLAGGAVAAAVLWFVLGKLREAQPGQGGVLSHPALASGLALLAIPGLGWFLVGERPLIWEVPLLQKFNFKGGLTLTPEFTALFLGLVVYTGAFIAEVVRAGILAVHKGQIEAAKALGLTNMQTLRLIILPQALRVIIPPLTSQYLNLAKNSSLAVAIGYPDLYSVGGTIYNQTGRPVPVVVMIMGSYLVMSLITSLFMNIYNRAVQLVER